MEYRKSLTLQDGRNLIVRNGTEDDGKAALAAFILAHEQTDNLLTYPDESTISEEQEARFLKEKTESPREVELIAEVDGVVAGLAGIGAIGNVYKVRHRAEFGISIDRAYWGLGIGKALTQACIECARKAGYEQLELSVIAGNERAIAMYKKAGFVEFGRNPRGFKSRLTGYQELADMRMEV